MISSTHNHSTGSDGKLSPEEVIKKAIELNWDYIYFTDHYPTPKELKFSYYNSFFSKEYIKNIKDLKEKYKDKIKVYFGAEIDWLNGYSDWLKKEIQENNFDYVLGSIHKIKFKEEYFDMEPGKENWIKNAEKIGGIEKFVQEYYKQIRLLIKSNLYDCLAHLDYIKVYNHSNEFFSENQDWYKKEILEVLDLLKEHKMALEINAGGLRRAKEQFPSSWILKEAKKRNIPITLGLDAHWSEHYNNESMKKIIDIAKHAGYNEVVRFEKRKMIKKEI